MGRRPLRPAPATRRTCDDPGRRHRLRHQLHPPARRRRRPRGRAHRPAAPDGGGAAGPGRRRHRPAGSGGDRAHPPGARRVRRRRRASSAPQRVRMVATSATRDAANRADFEDMVLATLGQLPDVVPGLEEAELSFLGATASLAPRRGARAAAAATAVPGRRHRRRLDRVRARGRRRGAGGPARWTSAACGSPSATCTATRRRPDEIAARRGRRPGRAGQRRRRGAGARRGDAWSAWPAR